MVRILTVLTSLGLLGVLTEPLKWLMTLFVSYSLVILICSFKKRKPKDPNYQPFVSILIPAHNEENVIENTVRSIMRQTYPKFEVIVIDDASDDNTPNILKRLQEEFPNLKVVRRELWHTRGKPAALNDGLLVAEGEVIGVFDADTVLPPRYLSRVVPYLSDPKVAGVQTKVRIYNKRQNLWTMLQDSEFAIYCSVFQAGRDTFRGCCGLGGNGQFVKLKALAEVGGWATGRLTEDFDLTLELIKRGYEIGYVDVPVYQEAVSSFKALFRQRTRWSQGTIQSTLRHIKNILTNKNVKLRTKFDTLYIFSTVIQPFILSLSLLITLINLPNAVRNFDLSNITWESSDLLSLFLFMSYFLFITIGHLKGKPEDWRLLPILVVIYYFYSFLWITIYFFSVGHYIYKRGKIEWKKTVHTGASQTS